MQIQYPPLFSLLSSFCYRALGLRGLWLLPLVGALFLLTGTARLGTLAGLHGAWASAPVLLCGLAMPVWFYAVVFWEHTPAAAFCIWSLVFCLRALRGAAGRELAIAAALCAPAIALRDELYLFALLVLLFAAFVHTRHRLRSVSITALSLALSLLPVWLLQAKLVGRPLGLHIGSNLAAGASYLAERPGVFFNLFAASGFPPLWSWVLAAPFLALFVFHPGLSPRAFRRTVPVLAAYALGVAVVALAGLLTDPSPALRLYRSNSLFVSAPLLGLGLVRPGGTVGGSLECQGATWIRRWAVLYALLYALAAPLISSQGMHWGTRYLFLLYPLLAVLIALNLAHWTGLDPRPRAAGRVAVAALLIASLGAQLTSLDFLARKRRFSRAANAALQERPEKALVTDVWWVPLTLYSGFFDRDCFYVQTREQLRQLRQRLLWSGEERYLFVTQAAADKRGNAVAFVDDEGLGLFALTYFSLNASADLPGPRTP